MKKDLSAIEIRQLVKEFQLLVNGRIEKIYQSTKKDIFFKIHPTGGSVFLTVKDRFIFLSNHKGDVPEKPTIFCTILRKLLENRKIIRVYQKDSERIIIFETESNILIFELFGQTNIILCDKDYQILAVNRGSKELSKGEKYSFPEARKDSFYISENDFTDVFKNSKKEVVKELASLIGGKYAEEACFMAGVDKNAKDIRSEKIKLLYSAFKQIINKEISPVIVFDDKGPLDVTLFGLSIHEDKNKVAFSTFYEAIHSFVHQTSEREEESKAVKKYQNQIQKVETIISTQKQKMQKLQKEIDSNTRAGESLYENYNDVKQALEDAKKGKKNNKIVLKNKKEKKIMVEL